MENIRRRIFEVIEASSGKDHVSKSYDRLIIITVFVGLIPFTLKKNNIYINIIDITTSLIFLVDYFFRVFTSDYKMGVRSYKAYLAYMITFSSLVDLLSVLPLLTVFIPNQDISNTFRLLRIVSVLKLARYTKATQVIQNVFRRVKSQLFTVMVITIVYIVASAMLIFQFEPEQFNTFFDAVYWATISITTIGYGDISPITTQGRLITMISALVGVAVIALPTGIISAAYMDEIKKKKGRFEL